jgi:hypothetical protein
MTYNTVATFAGRGIIWNRVANVSAGAVPKNIQWGTLQSLLNVTGSASANVNLFAPATEARTGGTTSILTTTALGDTLQITGTITCAAVAKTIVEAGLFDAVSPVSPTTTITNSLTTATTSLTLGTSLAGSVGNYYAQIGNETVLVTGANSTTLTVVRGAVGPAPVIGAWAGGTPITMGGDGGAAGWTTSQTVNSTSITASWGGNLFLKADFAPIALNPNDSISFTFSDTLT